MSVKLLVLYPTPKDSEQFDRRYEREHLPMGKASLIGATGLASYRILGSPAGKSPFARLTEVSFPTLEALHGPCPAPRRPWQTPSRFRLAAPHTSWSWRRKAEPCTLVPLHRGRGLPRPLCTSPPP
jgi:uncharacterized protein (TIGR02118 family)